MTINKNIGFDKESSTWDEDPMRIERSQTVAKAIKEQFPNAKQLSAMEFGCGTGLLSFELKDDFRDITLIDTSKGMISVLQEKINKSGINNFSPICTNLLNDKIELPAQDVIYTLMTLHHIEETDKIIEQFNKILTPNGYLCIIDLVKEDGSFHKENSNGFIHNGFKKETLSEILQNHNFKVTHYNETCYIIKKQTETGIKNFPLFLMIGQKQ